MSIIKRMITTRQAPVEIEATSENKAEMTLIFSTGFKGMRYDAGESYFEQLDMSEQACDLSRLNRGAPFLDQHNPTISSQIGVVTRAWIENGVGKATVKFSSRPEIQGIIQDVRDGIIKNISVGYTVYEYDDITQKGETTRTLLATRWQPAEISIVAIPFDPNAQVLRNSENLNEVIIKNREVKMTDEEKKMLEELLAKQKAEEAATQAEMSAQDETLKRSEEAKAEELKRQEAEKVEAELAEKKAVDEIKRSVEAELVKRSAEIKTAVQASGLNLEVADDMIARGISVQEASNEIFKKLEQRNQTDAAKAKESKKMTKQQLLEQALLNRINARKFPCDTANSFRGASLMGIAQELVERKTGESDMQFAQRAIASTDLANLLANVSNKVLAEDGGVQYSYSKIAEEVQLRDFKTTPIVRMAATGLSNKSSETGDYTDTSLTDSGENIQLKDRGALFKISYVSLMNDDLGVLSKLPQKADQMGGRDIETQLYAVLNANAAMSDTNTLFHASHNNIITGGTAPSVAQLDAAQQKMSAFQDSSGNPLDLTIKYIVVPPSQALAAQKVAAEIMAGAVTDVNPFAGKIEVIVSSRIAQVGGKDAWFCLADPKEYSALVYGTMQGQGDKPEVQVEEDFNSKNMKVRITQPSAAAAASYKGIVRIVLA